VCSWERDNVVYWKTNRKIKNDLQYVFLWTKAQKTVTENQRVLPYRLPKEPYSLLKEHWTADVLLERHTLWDVHISGCYRAGKWHTHKCTHTHTYTMDLHKCETRAVRAVDSWIASSSRIASSSTQRLFCAKNLCFVPLFLFSLHPLDQIHNHTKEPPISAKETYFCAWILEISRSKLGISAACS